MQSALVLADQHQVTTIALPGISSGIFGGPKAICARVIIQAAVDYLAQTPNSGLQEVRFCNIDDETAQTFWREAERIFR